MKSEGEWKSWLTAQYLENKDHGTWCHHFMANRWGNNGNSESLYFLDLQNHCRWWLQPWNEKMLPPWKKSYDQPGQDIKKQKHYFANKGPSSQSYGFSSSHVWMWELNYKESWALRIGTWTHDLLIRITYQVSGLSEAQVLCVSWQEEFSGRQGGR